jgi:hypothetical protein
MFSVPMVIMIVVLSQRILTQYSQTRKTHKQFTRVKPRSRPIKPSFTGIEHCMFLNLDHRKDRLELFIRNMNSSGISCERIASINPRDESHNYSEILSSCYDQHKCPGHLGCQLSHIKAVDVAIMNNWSNVAIFEDDFKFQPFFNGSQLHSLVNFITVNSPKWRVIGLSHNIIHDTVIESLPSLQFGQTYVRMTQINNAQTTGGLLFRDTEVLKRYRDLISLENCNVRKDNAIAIDQCMKPLQSEVLWVGLKPQIGTQISSFSDIEQMVVNYRLARRRY